MGFPFLGKEKIEGDWCLLLCSKMKKQKENKQKEKIKEKTCSCMRKEDIEEWIKNKKISKDPL